MARCHGWSGIWIGLSTLVAVDQRGILWRDEVATVALEGRGCVWVSEFQGRGRYEGTEGSSLNPGEAPNPKRVNFTAPCWTPGLKVPLLSSLERVPDFPPHFIGENVDHMGSSLFRRPGGGERASTGVRYSALTLFMSSVQSSFSMVDSSTGDETLSLSCGYAYPADPQSSMLPSVCANSTAP